MVLLFPEVSLSLSPQSFLSKTDFPPGARTLGHLRQPVVSHGRGHSLRDRVSPADPEEPEGASQPKLCHSASHTVRLRYRKGNQTACGSVPVTTNTNQCGLLERRESRWEILKDDIYILHLFFQG